jgi:LysM repeat protein
MGVEHMKHIKFFIFLCILTFTVSCGQQKKYIQYKVKRGETMSEIAQKLDMNTKDLVRLNPDVVDEPKANSFLVVPQKKLFAFKNKDFDKVSGIDGVSSDSIQGVDSLSIKEDWLEELKKIFTVYEVKKGDTFYSLEKLYNVTKEDLLLLNPELKEGLKEGMILKIRKIPAVITADEFLYYDEIERNINLKAALLLPFRAEKYIVDSIGLKETFASNSTLVNIATDFYLGAEIAVDSLRNQGINITLNVYDTGDRRSNKINTILSENYLNENDVIIGPLYSEEVQTVSSNTNVPVIYPVYSDEQAGFYASNIIKTAPDKNVFREELERYIKETLFDGNIIIVSDEKSKSLQTSNMMKASLESSANMYTTFILSPENGYIEKSKFLEILKPNTNNWVVIATDNTIVVSDVINSLISLPEETTAKIFTFNKGRVYSTIDNQKLAKLGFTYVSDDFDDANSQSTKIFNKQYLQKNNTLPSFYATKGFDITYDVLIRLASGKKLKRTYREGVSHRVDTKFDFRENSTDNKGLFIIQYNKDLTLTKLK